MQIIRPRPHWEHHLLNAQLYLYDNDRPVFHMDSAFVSQSSLYSLQMGHIMRELPSDSIKITDTFLYNGDLVALTRIQYLYDVVDEFIIVESMFTFSGRVKSQLRFMDPVVYRDFLPYMDKIKYLVIKETPPLPAGYEGPPHQANGTILAWWNEEYARSYFKFFIRPSTDDPSVEELSKFPHMYIIADCDEIPDKTTLWQLKTFGVASNDVNLNSPLHFNMKFYYYNFHWRIPAPWAPAYIISSHGLFLLRDVSLPRYSGGKYIGYGWHCSYFMSIDAMIHKIESFSHQEYNTAENKNPQHIQHCLTHGLDIFLRDKKPSSSDNKLQWVPSDVLKEELPAEFYSLHEKVLSLQNLTKVDDMLINGRQAVESANLEA